MLCAVLACVLCSASLCYVQSGASGRPVAAPGASRPMPSRGGLASEAPQKAVHMWGRNKLFNNCFIKTANCVEGLEIQKENKTSKIIKCEQFPRSGHF